MAIAGTAVTKRCVRTCALTLGAGAALMVAAPLAQAAVPTVATGAAKEVSYGSAVLTGGVTPNGSDTSYYFQYGVTRKYGSQTSIADAGSGTKRVAVSLPVTGLAPLTVYHYRLVAVNASGPAIGNDATLLTTKVPLSLSIFASPNPVTWGGSVTIQGTLSGTGNGNRQVVLQASTWPFFGPFLPIYNTELTTAAGGFAFPVLGLASSTEFRVSTLTSPPVTSSVVGVSVAVAVNAHLAATHRGGFVRVYGSVTPPQDGMNVGILRIVHGHGVLVAGATLRHRNASSSVFSRVVRSRPGVYRVLVRVTAGPQVSAYSQPLVIR